MSPKLLLIAMVLCIFGADPPITKTPALKKIEVLKIADGKETVQVTFYPGKGNAAKAAHYALTFTDARGKIDRKKTGQQMPVVDQKEPDIFTVIVEHSDSINYHMAFVDAVGPLAYDGETFLFTLKRNTPAAHNRDFLDTARAVKIWFTHAEVQAEEEWIEWHKIKPLEFSLEFGVTPENLDSLTMRTFRSPRNLPKTPEKVSKK